MNPDQLTTAFYMVARLCHELGEHPIKDKVWTHKIDDKWLVKINGCHVEKESIPPYHMMVEFNGFPAGCVSPWEGVFADGVAANEDIFIDAVIEKLESMGADMPQIKEQDMRKKAQSRISPEQATKEMNDKLDEWEDLE